MLYYNPLSDLLKNLFQSLKKKHKLYYKIIIIYLKKLYTIIKSGVIK
jgi:hypothetical protein